MKYLLKSHYIEWKLDGGNEPRIDLVKIVQYFKNNKDNFRHQDTLGIATFQVMPNPPYGNVASFGCHKRSRLWSQKTLGSMLHEGTDSSPQTRTRNLLA